MRCSVVADAGAGADMSPIVESPLFLADEAATLAFAQRFAADVQPPCSVALVGDLGAGKTTFVRGVLRALGVTGAIKSPTYAVMEPYELEGGMVWHFDFYRFNDAQEWEDAGFRDVFASRGLKLAEWPEKAEGLLPCPDLRIAIEPLANEARRVTLAAYTPRGLEILA